VIGALTFVERRFQTKDHLTGHGPQRTPGSLRELLMKHFVAADSKLVPASRFLVGHRALRTVGTLCGLPEHYLISKPLDPANREPILRDCCLLVAPLFLADSPTAVEETLVLCGRMPIRGRQTLCQSLPPFSPH
jgi:hypothetical protein